MANDEQDGKHSGLTTGIHDAETVAHADPKMGEEIELIAEALAAQFVHIIHTLPDASVRSTSSGVLTFTLRYLQTTLDYFAARPQEFGVVQVTYLEALNRMMQAIGDMRPTVGSKGVH